MILILTLLVPVDVLMRYGLNRPIAGLYELSELLLVGMVYLSITFVQAQKGHVAIDILYSKIPFRPRRVLAVFNSFLGIGITAVMTWRTAHLAWQAWLTQDYTSGLVPWPLWPAKAVISLGCGLLCLRLVRDLWTDDEAARNSRSR